MVYVFFKKHGYPPKFSRSNSGASNDCSSMSLDNNDALLSNDSESSTLDNATKVFTQDQQKALLQASTSSPNNVNYLQNFTSIDLDNSFSHKVFLFIL